MGSTAEGLGVCEELESHANKVMLTPSVVSRTADFPRIVWCDVEDLL